MWHSQYYVFVLHPPPRHDYVKSITWSQCLNVQRLFKIINTMQSATRRCSYGLTGSIYWITNVCFVFQSITFSVNDSADSSSFFCNIMCEAKLWLLISTRRDTNVCVCMSVCVWSAGINGRVKGETLHIARWPGCHGSLCLSARWSPAR